MLVRKAVSLSKNSIVFFVGEPLTLSTKVYRKYVGIALVIFAFFLLSNLFNLDLTTSQGNSLQLTGNASTSSSQCSPCGISLQEPTLTSTCTTVITSTVSSAIKTPNSCTVYVGFQGTVTYQNSLSTSEAAVILRCSLWEAKSLNSRT